MNSHVYAYSLPDIEYLGGVRVGTVPDWLTFTPDSKFLYVANAHSNSVSVIDGAARREIKQIKVGQVPKRNITAMLPLESVLLMNPLAEEAGGSHWHAGGKHWSS